MSANGAGGRIEGDLYERVFDILQRHLSAVNARSTLARAATRCGVRQRSISKDQLPQLLSIVERSAMLFLSPDKRDLLRADLGALHQRDRLPTEKVAVLVEQDIVNARAKARSICGQMGARMLTIQKVATVVSELARNIALYTPGGEMELTPEMSPARIRIIATDRGKGIPHLDQVLGGDYRSRTGLGRGLLGTRSVSSRFEIETGPTGTRVLVEILL